MTDATSQVLKPGNTSDARALMAQHAANGEPVRVIDLSLAQDQRPQLSGPVFDRGHGKQHF